MKKIVHVTSAHPRDDIRIFQKMCSTLAKNGYDVFLVVADGKGSACWDGVSIVDAGKVTGGRLRRMTQGVSSVLAKSIELNGDLYHLHDPELMPAGIKLKKLGKKVVFDAHEDLPKQILGKPYLNWISKRILAAFFGFYEKQVVKKFDAIISATPAIDSKFDKINKNTIAINNYPFLNELGRADRNISKGNEVAYVGGISEIRGIKELVAAMQYVDDAKLSLVGTFSDNKLREQLLADYSWDRIHECGQLNRDRVREVLSRSLAGIVTFLPAPNHLDSQPNKMFEYMSAGLPLIASNFKLWKEIIEKHGCGICVDPTKPVEIAKAINYLISNPEIANDMGCKGREAVESLYNWESECKKFLGFYSRIL